MQQHVLHPLDLLYFPDWIQTCVCLFVAAIQAKINKEQMFQRIYDVDNPESYLPSTT